MKVDFLPFCDEVSAVGHAAMLAAIKKYVPGMVNFFSFFFFFLFTFTIYVYLFTPSVANCSLPTASRSLRLTLLSGWML